MFTKTTRLLVIAVGISLLGMMLVGCGGGGGGGESVTWNGATTPATIPATMSTTESTAWALSQWATVQAFPGPDDVMVIPLGGASAAVPPVVPKVPGRPELLAGFLRGLAGRFSAGPIAAPLAYSVLETFVYYGNVSGSVSLTLEVDEVTMAFMISMVAEAYADTSEGYLVEQDGTCIMEGNFQELLDGDGFDFDVIFRDYQSSSEHPVDPEDFLFDGTYSCTFTSLVTTRSVNIQMDLAFEDHLADTACWFHDWDFTMTEDVSLSTETITGHGRTYVGDWGYVDSLVSPAIVRNSVDAYPSSGAVKFTGGLGRWAKIEFIDNNTYRVTACTDGDGAAERDSGELNWT